MGRETGIGWCHHTWSPWWGCTKVSPGCKYCYASELDNRFHHDDPHWGDAAPRRFFEADHWKQPRRWNRAAQKAGVRRRVFPSMCDPFEDRDDLIEVRERFWALIADTPWLDWLLLTKRPENIARMLPQRTYRGLDGYTLPWSTGAWKNVWLGTTTEDQEHANLRLPQLLAVTPPPPVFFASYEPALGPVDYHRIAAPDGLHASALMQQRDSNAYEFEATLDWVIVGCESGAHARDYEANWFRKARDQCAETGKAYYFKQGTDVVSIGRAGIDHPITLGAGTKVKGRAGRASLLTEPYLDGRQHLAIPPGAYADNLDDIYEARR